MQGDEGEFRGSVNRDGQVELALCCSNLSDVDMEIADRVGFEFSFWAPSFSTCGRREMPCRFRQRCNDDRVRCGIVACSAYRQSSSGSKVCRRNATTIASSSIDSTVELGCFGPAGRSATQLRLRHLATVFGLMPWRLIMHRHSPGPNRYPVKTVSTTL